MCMYLHKTICYAEASECIYLHMPTSETSRAKIVSRLEAEGWTNVGGGSHDKFTKPGVAYPIIVPRHRTLSLGVARSIAKAAGWT